MLDDFSLPVLTFLLTTLRVAILLRHDKIALQMTQFIKVTSLLYEVISLN